MQQLTAKYTLVNPQIIVLNNLRCQSGKTREFSDNLFPFVDRERGAKFQGMNVFSPGKFTRFRQRLVEVAL